MIAKKIIYQSLQIQKKVLKITTMMKINGKNSYQPLNLKRETTSMTMSMSRIKRKKKEKREDAN